MVVCVTFAILHKTLSASLPPLMELSLSRPVVSAPSTDRSATRLLFETERTATTDVAGDLSDTSPRTESSYAASGRAGAAEGIEEEESDGYSDYSDYSTEASVSADLTHIVLAADGASGIVLSSDFEWPATYGVWCLDTSDWSLTEIESTTTYVSGLAIDDRDRAWVSFQAPSWGAEDAVPGAGLYDSSTCATVQDDLVGFVLDPSSVAFY